MAERTLKLIIANDKQKHSLRQISELTRLTIEEVKQLLSQAQGLTPKNLGLQVVLLCTVLTELLPKTKVYDGDS
jgi:hypothetical protein